MSINSWHALQNCTVKQGYSEHAYIELTLTAKWFSLPMNIYNVVNLMDIMNFAYKEVKSPIPGTSFYVCFTVLYTERLLSQSLQDTCTV